MATTTDCINKEIRLNAPRSRVWRALTDSGEFGTWFRAVLDGPFQVGQKIGGRSTYPGHEHMTFDLWVERMEPEHHFAFRWHPGVPDSKVDYSKEPTTLVEFRLEDTESGVLLRMTESGFDALPEARRFDAFRANDGGWSEQMKNIQRHVEG